MAAGNTFGATALGSYGGFWISFAIILTPGGFDIAAQYTNPAELNYALGLFLFVLPLFPPSRFKLTHFRVGS
jgi:succinate-acetate transporter protein